MFQLMLLMLFGLCACRKQLPPPQQQEVPVDVTAYQVVAQSVPVDFDFLGIVQSAHQVQIRSNVSGTLEQIAYKQGTFVQKGDLLFQIDARAYEDEVKIAQANLAQQQAGLWQAQESLQRLKSLYEQRAASKKDIDDATAQFLSQQAAVETFKAKLDAANLDLASTSITSPIAGVTSYANYSEGTLILSASNNTLTTVSTLNPIRVALNISEVLFARMSQVKTLSNWQIPDNFDFDVTLTLSGGQPFPHKGKVSFISPLYNQNAGTLVAFATFDNPDFLLRPGQFVNTKVSGAVRLNTILVPQESIIQGTGSDFVFVITEERRAEMRPVSVGNWYKEFWIIESGLQPGERVVVAGVNKVKDGTLVKIKKHSEHQNIK